MIKTRSFLLLFFTMHYLCTACFQPEEGCLDIEATNFELSADRDCPEGDQCACKYPSATLQFEYIFDKSSYLANGIYQNNIGQYFRIQDIQFYISDIQLVRADDLLVPILDTITLTVLNAEAQQEKIVAIDDFQLIRQQSSATLGSIDKSGIFKALQFSVGVKTPENTTTPDDLTSSSHPLAIDSMYTSTNGYIFNRIVIDRDTNLQETTILQVTKKEGIAKIVLPLSSKEKLSGQAFSLGTLKINHAKWFDGINFVENTNEEMTQKIVTNTTNVFSLR